MDKGKRSAISTLSAQLTSTISVAMVLLILGIVALLSITAYNFSNNIKERMGFVLEISSEATADDIAQIKQSIEQAPYLSNFTYKSADDVLNEEKKYLGEEIMDVMDVNPYHGEFDVKVKPSYAMRDSLELIKDNFSTNKAIVAIHTNSEMVDSVNVGLNKFIIILGIVAIALLIISFVLINNTVRLTVYSRRFIIYTMKLVGAKSGFIRRPIVITNIINGIIAAIIAIAILSGVLYYAGTIDQYIMSMIGSEIIILVFIALIIAGILICAAAATFATNKYLRNDYDDMFK